MISYKRGRNTWLRHLPLQSFKLHNKTQTDGQDFDPPNSSVSEIYGVRIPNRAGI